MDCFDKLYALVEPPPVDAFDVESHTYTRNGVVVPSVSEILKNCGLQDYSNVPIGILENAAARGTAVHLACQLLDENNLDTESIDESLQGYLLSYQKWREHNQPKYSMIEQWQILPCGGLHYGATIDRIGTLYGGDEEWVFDIKTSAKKAPWWSIQTAAYDHLQEKRRGVIHCFKDGKAAQLIEYTDDTDYEVWESCLRLDYWKRLHK